MLRAQGSIARCQVIGSSHVIIPEWQDCDSLVVPPRMEIEKSICPVVTLRLLLPGRAPPCYKEIPFLMKT